LREKKVPPERERRIAFAFSERMAYPPVIHDMKAYYVTREMKARGARIDWVKVGGQEKEWDRDGIRFAVLRAPSGAHLTDALRIFRLALYCLIRRIQIVYIDEWLFLRKRPVSRLAGHMMLRGLGVRVVLDERDPYVDFEVAAGELREGSSRLRSLSRIRALLLRQTDLIVLPSKAYAVLYESEGMPKEKIFGIFRGVDVDLFKPQQVPNKVRSGIGQEVKFVIGWFGLMHSYRMIREVIIPLIENLSREIPNAHVLIGGEGPLLPEFERLRSSEAGGSFTLLGTIPYEKLPEYISACDVTICPVDPEFKFTKHSNWLKIAESISTGTPVVASRTVSSQTDYVGVKGVVWVSSDYPSFLGALQEIQSDLERYRTEAIVQAAHFDDYSTKRTIPKIVDRVFSII
jgi:glycosyltransferase involved in cell wall biosynthesis